MNARNVALKADYLREEPIRAEIRIVYPSEKFGTENNEFSKRHESMQADADEHYDLLIEMQDSDPLFEKLLNENHNRKSKVEKMLADSKNW